MICLQQDSWWLPDLAFIIRLITKIYELNTDLRGKSKAIDKMTRMTESFKGKLKSQNTQLMKGLLTHFPSASVDIQANGAFERYENLQLCLITNQLQERDKSDSAAIISSMFMENLSDTNFWNLVPFAQYPILKRMSLQLNPLFDSTCVGESGVATVDALISKYNSSLTVEHFNNCMRVPVAKDTPNC